MARITGYLLDAVRRPREQLTRGQHQVRYAWELTRHCWRQLIRHRAEGMAAELTYRTIFSLIPVVVLGLVMFRIVGGVDEVQQKVENQLYSFFGVPEIPEEYLQPRVVAEDTAATDEQAENVGGIDANGIDTKDGDADLVLVPAMGESPKSDPNIEAPEASTASTATNSPGPDQQAEAIDAELDFEAAEERREETRQATRSIIRSTLHDVTTKVASIDFASIGVVGLLLFIYAAVALADSTEYLFNRIFDAPKHRPIHIRLAIHWSIITLGSGTIGDEPVHVGALRRLGRNSRR